MFRGASCNPYIELNFTVGVLSFARIITIKNHYIGKLENKEQTLEARKFIKREREPLMAPSFFTFVPLVKPETYKANEI